MPSDYEIFYAGKGLLEIELNYKKGTAYFRKYSSLIDLVDTIHLDYWEFGALIKELEQIRRKLTSVDPWADPDMFTSGLD